MFVNFSNGSTNILSLTIDSIVRSVAPFWIPPKTSVMEMADEMKIDVLDEHMYKKIQQIEDIDLKTSSWIKTPDEIRKHGGAVFADRRYNHVFVYHNGAESYYAARGFRCLLRV